MRLGQWFCTEYGIANSDLYNEMDDHKASEMIRTLLQQHKQSLDCSTEDEE